MMGPNDRADDHADDRSDDAGHTEPSHRPETDSGAGPGPTADDLTSLNSGDGMSAPGDATRPTTDHAQNAGSSASSAHESPSGSSLGDDDLPSEIGEYQILQKIGSGGMGMVLKATHRRLKRDVAIKVMPRDRMNNSRAVASFESEMEAVGRLNHPHIVAAHDAGEVDGTLYLVMELIDGLDLGQLVDRIGPLPGAEACELIRQAAIALGHVEQNRLVHRDIKPSNLILGQNGRVKLLDLGLARLHTQSNETSEGGQVRVAGTADFMAPEQAGDFESVDIRADIYSLGCTLYFLLTGHAPFVHHRSTNMKLLAHAAEEPPSVAEKRTDVSQLIFLVLGKMMEKMPDDRFQSPGEVVDALTPYCMGANVGALVWKSESQVFEETHDVSRLSQSATMSTGPSRTDSLLQLSQAEMAEVYPELALDYGTPAGRTKKAKSADWQQLMVFGAGGLVLLIVIAVLARGMLNVGFAPSMTDNLPEGFQIDEFEVQIAGPDGVEPEMNLVSDAGKPYTKFISIKADQWITVQGSLSMSKNWVMVSIDPDGDWSTVAEAYGGSESRFEYSEDRPGFATLAGTHALLLLMLPDGGDTDALSSLDAVGQPPSSSFGTGGFLRTVKSKLPREAHLLHAVFFHSPGQ